MTATSHEHAPLGRPGCPVRVLNFAGGGFDTIMQLGVAHALLVIQGRAPDAIVGVSAGAIQAVAVAEVLQAGDKIVVDPNETVAQQRENYQQCRAARVERFRDMVNAAQRAPEELIDASLPDTYQIDSRDPLQPLRTARFVKRERDEREGHLRMRSGLVALYNQLLHINLPVGSITRIVRRWLGLKAAAEFKNRFSKFLVKTLELLRIWLLFGAELHRLVTAVPLLLRPVLFTKTHARVATAGSLIFRFRIVRFMWLMLGYSLALFILASTWVTVTTSPAIVALGLVRVGGGTADYWLDVVALPYLIPLLITLIQVARKHDAVTRFGALADGVRGLVQFAVSLFLWGGVPFTLLVWVKYKSLDKLFETSVNDAHILAATILGVGAALFVAIGVWTLGRFWLDRARQRVDGAAKVTFLRWYGQRFLHSYSLSHSLLHPYGLERFLAELFDRDYYGRIDERGERWERSLEEPPIVTAPPSGLGRCLDLDCAIKIRHYSSEGNPRIVLGLGVADVSTGKVDVMDEDAPLVCGLRAATALAPLFPALRYRGRLFIDSTNVTAVPMPALLSLLHRNKVNEESTVIHAYRVSPVPFSRPPRDPKPRTFVNLIDIAFRAIKLRQYRDADLERRLTERYTKSIPAGKAVVAVSDAKGGHDFFRIWVAPVELELPLGLNTRIMFAERTERRAEVLRTIAQGCRAALQVMIADAIKETCDEVQSMTVTCARAVHQHLKHGIAKNEAETFGCLPLPGSRRAAEPDTSERHDSPPGLSEICDHCELRDDLAAERCRERQQVLVCHECKDMPTHWPHEFETEEADPDDRHFETKREETPDLQAKVIEALGHHWPHERRDASGTGSPIDRPLVSLLFSGGVFRGVFQVGAINALKILKVTPDIVAGASVGSITGAMAAQLLTDGDNKQQLARLAAVYLSVDRVILTDRFADFVREFTIRAAATRFSLRQADRLFRKYDKPWLFSFDKGARQVIAGIERLFYVSPYQMNQLVKTLRHREGRRAVRLGRTFGQQWLDRMNVGEEILGADSLKELINYFIPLSDRHTDRLKDAPKLSGMFTPFLDKGVMLLATTANLSGELLTLGDPFHDSGESSRIDLTNALLASSAFPGVFRPRWAPEVFPDTYEKHQFIDGGVMDNLPIDAVFNVLLNASSSDPNEGLIVRRPTSAQSSTNESIPHLAFAVSLEPKLEDINRDDALSALEGYWPALMTRAKQLGYNGKLDDYCQAAREINELHEQFNKPARGTAQRLALNLEIVALKPRWLCGTFAFHPMLGYRRAKQAESIAHGCALTLLRFAECDKEWVSAWGMDLAELPEAATLMKARELWEAREPSAIPGECWLRKGKQCPFSVAFLEEQNSQFACGRRLAQRTIREISRIHESCKRRETHEVH
jgi:predicted acylesterase/phospholipase RssA